jgi:glycosyltransferase involved in cell wall biosynthesis
MDLSVILPIYNEESNIPDLFARIKKVADGLNVRYEFLFVNDGSTDQSIVLIKQLASQYDFVKFIDFSRNFGHQVAVSAGIDHAKGKYISIIDSDLQDPPELIPEMFLKIKEGFDVVYARRRSRKDKNIFKKFAYKFFYRLLAKISTIPIPLDTGDFRIMSRRVVEILKQMPEKEKFLRGQIAWVGFRQTFVEYDRDARAGGETGYSYKKLFGLALDGITSFSNFPLRFASWAGLIVSGISFLLILYALYSHYFLNDTTPKGWASLMISSLFIGGILLLSIGIIGEYLSRLSTNIRNRPLYIIGETNVSSDN